MYEATYPCKVKMWFIVSSNAVIHHLTTHRRTHRQTDRRTHRQTDVYIIMYVRV